MKRGFWGYCNFISDRFWRTASLAIILICGFGTRMYDLKDPPLDYAGARQLRSALIARGKYYALLDNAPEWKREIAITQQKLQDMIEPEIIESITAITYYLAEGEYIWIARIYSSLFWVLGGLALYFLTSSMVSEDGGVIAILYYLFVPFGLVASRTFQPDPLMTALIITSWMTFHYWYKTQSWKWAILSGVSAGAALFVKSTAIFYLLVGMGLVIFYKKKLIDIVSDLQVWVIGLLSALPPVAYAVYGLWIVNELQSQLKGRFFPQMWSDPDFFLQWRNALLNVTGYYMLLVGMIGLLLIKNARDRLFLIGIWLGYIFYGFTLSYHVSTHYYYTLPVIPLAAVTIGAVADWIIQKTRSIKLDFLIIGGFVVALLLGVGGGYFLFYRDDYRQEVAFFQKVADFVDPEDRIVGLSQDYGSRLSFYGWRIIQPWKGTEDLRYIELRDSNLKPFSERFSEYSSEYDYFIVTRMREFRRQENLYEELYGHYPVLAEGDGYVIFNLRERVD